MPAHANDLLLVLMRLTAVAFVVMFLFVGYFTIGPRLSGWSKLVKTYPYKGTLPQKKYMNFYVNLGKQSAPERAAVLSVDEKGIYMWKYFPLVLTYKPIFVPWSDITLMEPNKAMIKRARIKIIFEKVPEIFITIYGMLLVDTFMNELVKNSPKPIVHI